MVVTYKSLLERGTPKKLHIVALISSIEGVEYVKKNLPENTTLWVGAIDDELTGSIDI